jgi:hypothetical protein
MFEGELARDVPGSLPDHLDQVRQRETKILIRVVG